MNWIDIIVIFILIYGILKGLSLGLVGSIFNVIQIVLSLLVTKIYYPYIAEYITSNPRFYNLLKDIITKVWESEIVVENILRISINVLAILIVFFIVNVLLALLLSIFSFLVSIPVLRQINEIGGMVFGLLKGLFIVYFLNLILYPIASRYPLSFFGKGILNSFTFNYLKDINLLKYLLSIDKFI